MMRFNSRQILSIGCTVLLSGVWGTYWLFFVPKLNEKEGLETMNEDMKIQRLKYKQAKKRDLEVRKKIDQMEKDWNKIVDLYTPPKSPQKGGIDLSRNRWQITADLQKYSYQLQNRINRFITKSGVELIKPPVVPQAPISAVDIVEQYFNYPSISFPVAVLEMGEVCAKGTYSQLIGHLKSWNDFKEAIPILHQIKIAGTSPDLYAFYQLALIVYIKADKISPKVPEDIELAKTGQLKELKK